MRLQLPRVLLLALASLALLLARLPSATGAASISSGAGQDGNGYVLSCKGAATLATTDSSNAPFCAFVTWRAARLYNADSFNYWDAGTALGATTHVQYAQFLYVQHLVQISQPHTAAAMEQGYDDTAVFAVENLDCSQAVQRLSCLQALPECPIEGGSSATSVSYLPPCRVQCEQTNAACSGSDRGLLDCTTFQTENCIVYAPLGMFLPTVDGGPYGGMSPLYAVLLLLWGGATLAWGIAVHYTHHRKCLKICRYMLLVLAAKTLTVLMSLIFWATCASWGMCSNFLMLAMSNCQLLFEAVAVQVLMMIGRGWSLSAPSDPGAMPDVEIQDVPLKMGIFYIASSILSILRQEGMAGTAYATSVTCVYAVLYFLVARDSAAQLRRVSSSLSKLKAAEVPLALRRPLEHRRAIFCVFLVLVLVLFAMEVLLQTLLWSATSGFAVALVAYEMCSLIVYGALFFTLRPQEVSPLFFMEVTSRNIGMDSLARKPATTLEMVEAAEEEDGETARLVAPVALLPKTAAHGESSSRARLVVVRAPTAYAMGLDSNYTGPQEQGSGE